jgi:hypothetical protein
MLLPEARLDILLDQLKALSAPDRKAVLARLENGDRSRVLTLLRRDSSAPAKPISPYSADIAARIAALASQDGPMTAAGRTALAVAVDPELTAGPKAINRRSSSLADTIGDRLRRGFA